jgi:hypothetical protein
MASARRRRFNFGLLVRWFEGLLRALIHTLLAPAVPANNAPQRFFTEIFVTI